MAMARGGGRVLTKHSGMHSLVRLSPEPLRALVGRIAAGDELAVGVADLAALEVDEEAARASQVREEGAGVGRER